MTTTHDSRDTSRALTSDHAGDRQTLELYGHRITHTNNPDVQQLLAAAHTDRIRPLCLCRPDGVAMYVAKIGPDKYVIKRMPGSGLEHAHRCASYLPPEELSGLGQVLGSAITEEADSGLTAIKLGFRMSKAERAAPTGAGGGVVVADSVAADPNRLTLRAVLHYLWQEADLATWSPGMDGKRNWRIVWWHLRQAARGKFTKGKPLATRLYVPEPFNVEKKTEIAARRLSAWAPMQQHGSGPAVHDAHRRTQGHRRRPGSGTSWSSSTCPTRRSWSTTRSWPASTSGSVTSSSCGRPTTMAT